MPAITKKIITVVACVVLGTSVVSCGSGNDTGESRNAAVVAGTQCKKPGQYTKISGQKVVCGRTDLGAKWFSVSNVRKTKCRTLGTIRKSNGVAFVCGRTKTSRVWISTKAALPAAAAPNQPETMPAVLQQQLQSTDAGVDPVTAADPGVVQSAPEEPVAPVGATTTTIPRVPGPYASDLKVKSVVSSSSSACAILQTGAVSCWGLNASGDLGNPKVSQTLVPVANAVIDGTKVQAVSIASSPFGTFCAAVTTGAVWCWGYGTYAELGNGGLQSTAMPTMVKGLGPEAPAVKVFGGPNMFCAIDSLQRMWCWGANGATGRIPTPKGDVYVTQASQVTGMETVKVSYIAITFDSACALTTAGSVWCWGSNFRSTMGTAKFQGQFTVAPATLVEGIGQAPFIGQQIVATLGSVCVVSTLGAVKCWGLAGLIGVDTQQPSPVPVNIALVNGAPLKAKALHSGVWSICATTAEGALWCWGTVNNEQGNWSKGLMVPTLINGFDGIAKKASGYASSGGSMFVISTGSTLNIISDGFYGLRGDGYPAVEDPMPS